MTKRYFKATDGLMTVFRGTGRPEGFRFASVGRNSITFSNTPRTGHWETVEITKAEYNMLTALKLARLRAAGHRYLTSPSDCWVSNVDLYCTEHPDDVSFARRYAGTPASRDPQAEAV